MVKYKNLNYITLVAMIMLVNIHFFNTFNEIPSSAIEKGIMYTLRGMTVSAVSVYLANTAFTSLKLQKGADFKKLYLYILIPTVLLTQLQYLMFKAYSFPPVTYNFADGFSSSWFGEMYLYMMMLIPLFLYLHNKSKLTQNLLFVYALIMSSVGYIVSIIMRMSTTASTGLLMMFTYSALVYVLFRIIDFLLKHITDKNIKFVRIVAVLMILLISGLETLFYAGMLDIRQVYICSYFSPLATIFAVAIWILIYTADLSKLPEVRALTKGSYFYFFTHWIMIRILKYYAPSFVAAHIWISLILTFTLAILLAYILFTAYDYTIRNILKI